MLDLELDVAVRGKSSRLPGDLGDFEPAIQLPPLGEGKQTKNSYLASEISLFPSFSHVFAMFCSENDSTATFLRCFKCLLPGGVGDRRILGEPGTLKGDLDHSNQRKFDRNGPKQLLLHLEMAIICLSSHAI